MASRRVRIKGIANIPIRRKVVENGNGNEEKTNAETELTNQKDDDNLKNENDQQQSEIKIKNDSKTTDETLPITDNKQSDENSITDKLDTNTDDVILNNNLDTVNKNINCDFKVQNNKLETTEKQNEPPLKENGSVPSENKFRRWVSKPSVRLPTIPRKIKFEEPPKNTPEVPPIEHTENKQTEPEPIPEEIKSPDITKKLNLDKPLTVNIEKAILSDVNASNSEVSTPLSPNKTVNRARIRPVPRLIRRSSIQGSASESEDDGRKSRTRNDSISSRTRNDSICSRTRNDSVCSIANSETGRDDTTQSNENKIKAANARKFRPSEQSRKMAMAKREFYIKFGQNMPDRKKLTMMDLIFYNPTTNPMPEKSTKTKDNNEETVEIINDQKEDIEEDPDDPLTISDEENIPVPQVKVGPDGEIILDEQSLVIEQTGIKKGREQIANSQVVIDDLDTGYGIYKKPKKGKEWNVTETLRFYRTLNTVGTDFSLMLSLFPGRTRRELKLKFKKEERINRVLIDKVLTNPLDFNLSELEKQFEEEDLRKSKKAEIKKQVREKKKRERTKTSVASRLIEDSNENTTSEIKTKKRRTIKKQLEKKEKEYKDDYSILENGIESILDSESEEETSKITDEPAPKRPTRACRQNANYLALIESEESDIENGIDSFYPIIENEQRPSKRIKIDEKPKEINRNLLQIEEEENMDETSEDTPLDLDLEEVETNIVIAHSENNEPDKISIDIFSKDRTGAKVNESKVCLDLNEGSEELLQIENFPEIPAKTNEPTNNIEIDTDPVIPTELPHMEPGSLMILSSNAPTGEKIFKVYMVTPNKENIPVDLSPDIVKSLTTSLGSAEEVTIDLPVIDDES